MKESVRNALIGFAVLVFVPGSLLLMLFVLAGYLAKSTSTFIDEYRSRHNNTNWEE